MADTASIAIRRDTAIRRMQDAMTRIGEVTGLEPVTLPAYDRDPAYLEAWRLDVLAGYIEQVANEIGAQPADDLQARRAETEAELNALTVAELDADAERLGLDWPARGMNKGDKVAALMAQWDAQNAPADDAAAPEVGENGI